MFVIHCDGNSKHKYKEVDEAGLKDQDEDAAKELGGESSRASSSDDSQVISRMSRLTGQGEEVRLPVREAN